MLKMSMLGHGAFFKAKFGIWRCSLLASKGAIKFGYISIKVFYAISLRKLALNVLILT